MREIVEYLHNFRRTSWPDPAYAWVMVVPNKPVSGETRLTPETTFVVQLRSDSSVPDQDLRGRVEHVMSGESEQFATLAQLLAFMGRYQAAGEGESQGEE